ncbi:uncharacterized protein (DUF305 family) [Kibdelosporangium banguiense]|uniref:Uncharacterized protein (DUF305 family) n=1 Tax=Kibdelosporangium banguiense TaxID=1365924 RepID=A0ABS4U3D8_9PSEU|nr:DUF305 domain-containing protein [Kibdelosporangium banguiense]MBP2330698.1 uncharacterized protein (DUF305 family) [Kibdelosporangium banguiense]
MRKFLVGASAAAVLALIAGCGSSGNDATMAGHSSTPTPTSSAPAANNADDISFAQGMIPHHAQAVEMAKLVPSRSTNPKMLALATRVQQAQDPEIQQLTDMLKKWGSAPASTDHGSMDHGGGGMMTADEMKQLEAAKGAEFDRMWTQMMIKHHEGAIKMARTELGKGASGDAKALAQKIIDAQQAEITEMQALL